MCRHLRAAYLATQLEYHQHHPTVSASAPAKPQVRLTCVELILRCWYLFTPLPLIRAVRVQTGMTASLDGSGDDKVKLFVDQDRVPFSEVRQKAQETPPTEQGVGSSLMAAEKEIEKKAKKIEDRMLAAYLERVHSRELKKQEKTKKRKKKPIRGKKMTKARLKKSMKRPNTTRPKKRVEDPTMANRSYLL